MKILRVILIGIAAVGVAYMAYAVIVYFPARPIAIVMPPEPAPAQKILTKEAVGKPTLLSIPSLRVSARIQEVGLTTAGAMANPQGPNKFRETGWYKDGPRPGQAGSAVIDGHLDNALGFDGVFIHLNRLKAGDTVQIKTDQNELLTFVVLDQQTYDYTHAPNAEIFTRNNGTARLNLITCDGTWIQSIKSYDKRLVVYTELISITP